jgi:hypothetical protein
VDHHNDRVLGRAQVPSQMGNRAPYQRRQAQPRSAESAVPCARWRCPWGLSSMTEMLDATQAIRLGQDTSADEALKTRPSRMNSATQDTSGTADPRQGDVLSAAEAEVHAERWRCIKIRPRRCPRRRGRDCLPVRRALNNRARSRRSGWVRTARKPCRRGDRSDIR